MPQCIDRKIILAAFFILTPLAAANAAVTISCAQTVPAYDPSEECDNNCWCYTSKPVPPSWRKCGDNYPVRWTCSEYIQVTTSCVGATLYTETATMTPKACGNMTGECFCPFMAGTDIGKWPTPHVDYRYKDGTKCGTTDKTLVPHACQPSCTFEKTSSEIKSVYDPVTCSAAETGIMAYFDGSVVYLAGSDSPVSELKVRKGTTTYSMVLVATSHPDASRVWVRTATGVQAIKKCVAPCAH